MNKPSPLIWGANVSSIPHLGSSPFITGRKANEVMAALTYQGGWRPRNEVETDRTWRQVIPYIIITNVDTGKHLLFERTPKQDESRLHTKLSIAAGGHIEKEDDVVDSSGNRIERAAWRETMEETSFHSGVFNFCGCLAITDPKEDEVHHVHIAAVYHLFTQETDFKGEDDKHIRRWVYDDTLQSEVDRMEAWSREVWNYYLAPRT